jgi:hypothetical protein
VYRAPEGGPHHPARLEATSAQRSDCRRRSADPPPRCAKLGLNVAMTVGARAVTPRQHEVRMLAFRIFGTKEIIVYVVVIVLIIAGAIYMRTRSRP